MIDDDSRGDLTPDTLEPGEPAAVATTLLSPRAKLVIFGVLIVGALAFFAMMMFKNATVYYLTVGELASQGPTEEGRLVRVAGKLVKGSFERAPNGLDVSFEIRDEDGGVLPITYAGEVGQLFFNDHSDLILEGVYDGNGEFSTQTLIVKCPTKYVNIQDETNEAAGEWVDPPYETEDPDAGSGA